MERKSCRTCFIVAFVCCPKLTHDVVAGSYTATLHRHRPYLNILQLMYTPDDILSVPNTSGAHLENTITLSLSEADAGFCEIEK